MIQKIKNFLKRFLPPPVHTFNREVERILAAILSLRTDFIAKLEARHKEELDRLEQLRLKQEKLFDEMTKQLCTSQREIIDNMTAQVQAAQAELTGELSNRWNQLENEYELILQKMSLLDNKTEALQGGICENNQKLLEMYGETAEIRKTTLNTREEVTKTYREILNTHSEVLQDGKKLNDTIQNEQNKILQNVEHITRHAVDASRNASETVWAETFNNTISNSMWLKNTAFSPGRWAVGYPYLYVMYRVLNETKPKHILEMGLGQSTKMIAQYAAAHEDVEHIVVEQDAEWINFFKENYSCPASTQLLHLPAIEINFLDDDRTLVYQDFSKHFKDMQFDFISVDGPGHSSSQKYRRIDLLDLVPQVLNDSFCIMWDDRDDTFADNAYSLLIDKLRSSGTEFKSGQYSGKKTLSVISSPDKEFLCTL